MLVFEHSIDQAHHVESGNGDRFNSKVSLASCGSYRHGELPRRDCLKKKPLKARRPHSQVVAKRMTAALLWRAKRVIPAKMGLMRGLNLHLPPALLCLLLSFLQSLLPVERLPNSQRTSNDGSESTLDRHGTYQSPLFITTISLAVFRKT